MSANARASLNQRLYFCDLQCQLLLSPPDSPAQRAYIAAAQESLIYHLLTAYQVYLQELAYIHCQHTTQAQTATELSAELAGQEIELGEVNELAQLEATKSWLSDLQRAFNSRKNKNFSAAKSGAEIQFVSINTEENELTTEQIVDAVAALKAVVDGHRGNMDES